LGQSKRPEGASKEQKKNKLDTQIAFNNREIARIDHERAILEEDVRLIEILRQIAELLV